MSSRLVRIVLVSLLAGVAMGSIAAWAIHSANQSHPAPLMPMPGLANDHTPGRMAPLSRQAAPASVPDPATAPSAASNAAPPPAPAPVTGVASRRSESRGPFELDGAKFTLKVDLLCRHFDKDKNACADDYGESAEAYSLLDSSGNVQFQKTLPQIGLADYGAFEVYALRLEGRSHQALQIATREAPSAPDTGFSSDFFAFRSGKLSKFAEGIDVDALDSMQGPAQKSWKLAAGDTFSVREISSIYYDRIAHYKFNWQEGRLDPLESNEFNVEPHQGEHPDDTAVDFYPAPDFNAKPIRVHIGTGTKIVILKVVRTATSQDASGKQVVTEWLRISIDGRIGYISGDADFGAIGLAMAG